MKDYKHFPRVPRNNDQPIIDLVLFFMIVSMVVIAFGMACKEEMYYAGFASEGMIKETVAIHAKEQKERDEKAALYLYTERAK